MKEKKGVTVYKCDYCNKKLFRKHAMFSHEIKCKQNPLNIRACFDCSMCEKVEIKFEPEIQTYHNNNDLTKSHSFKCLSKNIFMFPPKMEHSEGGLPSYVLHEGLEIDQEKMPILCNIKTSIDDRMNMFFKNIN